jgi:hypothetical protein
MRVLRATVAPKIVLARGEKSGWSFICGAAVELACQRLVVARLSDCTL